MGFIVLIIAVIGFFWWRRAQRRKKLLEKYRDDEIVRRIMSGEFWEGQTTEQLLDSLGKPRQRDSAVFKNKTKDTWKYKPMGRGQYRLRIIVENDLVVGWKTNAR
jgi:hypothetical protein